MTSDEQRFVTFWEDRYCPQARGLVLGRYCDSQRITPDRLPGQWAGQSA
jgi:hypothetical protein